MSVAIVTVKKVMRNQCPCVTFFARMAALEKAETLVAIGAAAGSRTAVVGLGPPWTLTNGRFAALPGVPDQVLAVLESVAEPDPAGVSERPRAGRGRLAG